MNILGKVHSVHSGSLCPFRRGPSLRIPLLSHYPFALQEYHSLMSPRHGPSRRIAVYFASRNNRRFLVQAAEPVRPSIAHTWLIHKNTTLCKREQSFPLSRIHDRTMFPVSILSAL
ncbi:hypothetical protein BV22DRAFT_592997 [Leucogyrophana mollusca]|uniref:Uncharacterized protein n=1 Tax=Leucogyrophana mollusca TaxID=85980 RepID=A0ACB8BC90_9AGAM|nr:hypothetical protein BV22DRAFT_592997 [Leucogyrophana mollusca]